MTPHQEVTRVSARLRMFVLFHTVVMQSCLDHSRTTGATTVIGKIVQEEI